MKLILQFRILTASPPVSELRLYVSNRDLNYSGVIYVHGVVTTTNLSIITSTRRTA